MQQLLQHVFYNDVNGDGMSGLDVTGQLIRCKPGGLAGVAASIPLPAVEDIGPGQGGGGYSLSFEIPDEYPVTEYDYKILWHTTDPRARTKDLESLSQARIAVLTARLDRLEKLILLVGSPHGAEHLALYNLLTSE